MTSARKRTLSSCEPWLGTHAPIPSVRPQPTTTRTVDEARLLPRCRPGAVFQAQSARQQDHVALLVAYVDLDSPQPLRDALTKPGDPLVLRGIPAIGRSVSGAIRETQPEQETIRRITLSERKYG